MYGLVDERPVHPPAEVAGVPVHAVVVAEHP